MDYVTNENPAPFRYLNEKGLIPDYVINSYRVTQNEVDNLSTAAFADPFNREYPCHTKAACWQAAVYAAANGGSDELLGGILKFASAHDCLEDCQAAIAALQPQEEEEQQEKNASAQEAREYALRVDLDGFNGRGVEDHYPINNPAEVMVSSNSIAQDFNSHRLPMPMLRKAACAAMSKARELEMDVADMNPLVVRFGTEATPDTDDARYGFGLRKNAGADPAPYIAILDGLRNGLDKSATAEEAIKLGDEAAQALWELDQRNHVRYTHGLQQDPYTLLFTGPTPGDLRKAAAASMQILGVRVPSFELCNMSENTVKTAFSKSSSAVIAQAREILAGAPDMEKAAAATSLIASLPHEVQKLLLDRLVNTGWES